MFRRATPIFLVTVFLISLPARAQLNRTFEHVFDDILREGFRLSPDEHGDHFLPAADEANSALAPPLNSLIAGNIASFPLSSNVAGVTVRVVDGQPVVSRGSLGPIVAETAQTLSPGELMVGFNATHLSLDRFRGLPLEDMQFTFLHSDVDAPGLGDNPNESDVVNVLLGLDVDASIFALYAAYGIAPNFDVTLAIPFVNVTLKGEAQAVVESFTFARGGANHFFGGTSQDPELVKTVPYDASAAGIGNIAVQLKYGLPFGGATRAALWLDVRMPTGDEGDFRGTGSSSVRGMALLSRSFGDFTPHLNLGYDYRRAELDSDEFELIVGFDQKLAEGLTFALDILGEFDVEPSEAFRILPGTTIITDTVPITDDAGTVIDTLTNQRLIRRSNIPDRRYDNTVDASIGLWIAPTENFQILGNLIVPLQSGGLRSDIAPTIGMSLSF